MSFSRDGKWVTYATYPEGDIWRSRLDGTEKLQLTSAAMANGWSPVISADGERVAFVGVKAGIAQQIYVASMDGGAPRSVHIDGTIPGMSLSWCGPGKNLLISGDAEKGSRTALFDLETSKTTYLPGSEGSFLSYCSPDGKHVAARTVGGDKLRLFEFATQQWSEIVSHSVGSMQWSGDNKYVYFDTGLGAEQAVYRVRLQDRNVELIGNFQDFRRTVLPWVSWMGLTPDGSPLLMRDISTQEVYALDFEAP